MKIERAIEILNPDHREHYDGLGWVRFVRALPCPGWVKTFLWGWA